jgi:cystathionine beta-lyase/cystathionine gamma-synthase
VSPPPEAPPLRMETHCVRAREGDEGPAGPLVAPVYQSAVWAFASLEDCETAYDPQTPGYIYTRDANPNHAALERALAGLEGAAEAVVFGTGMAAIAGAVVSLTRAGGRILAARQLYGVSVRLLSEELSRFGVRIDWVDVEDLAAVEAALAGGADALLVETLANPLLQIADLPALATACRSAGCALVVDSTFASPWVCRPLEFGADVVVHSLTKILGGHSDLTLGAAATANPEIGAGLRRYARWWGGAANPFESWLALRGLATYPLRIQRSCENALALAQRLAGHPAVRRVYYPGLASHPGHALALRLTPGFGHMLAFDLADGPAAAAFLRNLRVARFAPSLGDVATTVSYPVATSQRGLAPERLAEMGISPGTIRVSVGIDHIEDVWADFEQALS